MQADDKAYKKSSFGPAFLFLDKKRRRALAAYYAFCRQVDDIADEPDVEDREKELDSWRAEIHRVFAGTPETELGRALKEVRRQFGMPPDRFLLLIEGMEADIQGRSYATLDALEWYLWRVAGVVGMATLDILGISGDPALDLAYALGFAVQTTNIIRDVHEDARLGRVYLPQELLQAHGLTREEVLQNAAPDKLAAALRELADCSKAYYARAERILHTFPARAARPCRVMGLVYRKNLAKIEKTNFIFTRAVKLTRYEKLFYGICALCGMRLQ